MISSSNEVHRQERERERERGHHIDVKINETKSMEKGEDGEGESAVETAGQTLIIDGVG